MATDRPRNLTRFVFLNGTVGSGKSSTASAIGAALRARQIPHAIIDVDELSTRWPQPRDDPFDFHLTLANLASVSANYRAVGVGIIVAAGVIETKQEYQEYQRRLGDVEFNHVMLTAPLAVVEQRLKARHADSDELAWHLQRAPELASILTSAGLPGPTFNTDQPVQHIAHSIVRAVIGP